MKNINKKLYAFLLAAMLLTILAASSFALAGELKVTEEHPFYVNGSWIPAKQLAVGDVLKTVDGKEAEIIEIEDIETSKPFFVYNFEDTFGINNYAAGLERIIVHNSYLVKTKFGNKFNKILLKVNKKPSSWSNDDWNEYLLSQSSEAVPHTENSKSPALVGKQISHIEAGGNAVIRGGTGSVFMLEGSKGKRVVKVFIGEDPESTRPVAELAKSAASWEKHYLNEIEAMKIADRLGLRKFYGEVEVQNLDVLLDTSKFPGNKRLLAKRAYAMDYVEGDWASINKRLPQTTEATLADGIEKYRKLYDDGWIQADLQFLVTPEGKVEIIDFGSLMPKGTMPFSDIEEKISLRLGL